MERNLSLNAKQHRRGKQTIDNPEKLTTCVHKTQDEETQNKKHTNQCISSPPSYIGDLS